MYYKNYKIEKNIPMNLTDQSKILNDLINNINKKESDFRKLTLGLAKILDIRSYFYFKETFLKKSSDLGGSQLSRNLTQRMCPRTWNTACMLS